VIPLLLYAIEEIRHAQEMKVWARQEMSSVLMVEGKILSSFGMLCRRSELDFGVRGSARRPGAMM
jgi:hypothetical protein